MKDRATVEIEERHLDALSEVLSHLSWDNQTRVVLKNEYRELRDLNKRIFKALEEKP